MKKKVFNELLLVCSILILISGVHVDAKLYPSSGIAFQGSESSIVEDQTSYIQNSDGSWAPPTSSSIPYNYYATGLDSRFWDALSVKFNTGEYNPSEYTAILRFYAQRGSYNTQWNHYIVLQGDRNPTYQDADWEAVANDQKVQSLGGSSGSWFEEELPGSYWNSGSFWVTLRMWNVRVDAVELDLIPNDLSSITVTSPNGGETWVQGSTHLITWTSSGDAGSNVRIDLLKGGSLYRTLANTLNDGSCSWTLLDAEGSGSDYQVRITSSTNPAITDTSNNYFTIVPETQSASITVTSPNGGETWVQGSTHLITWTSSGDAGSNVRIDLLKGGSLYRTLANTLNDGSCSWTLLDAEGSGSDYQVRITSSTNPAITDTSNNYFTIVPETQSASITVTSPNGGETWVQGSTHLITWTSSGDAGSNVRIDLLKGGSLYRTLANTLNDGSCSWTLLDAEGSGSDYQVRITSSTNPAIMDTSNNYFTIAGSGPDDELSRHMSTIETIIHQYPTDLATRLNNPSETQLRRNFVTANGEISSLLSSMSPSDPRRDTVYAFYKTLITEHPNYFKKTFVYNLQTQSIMSWMRELSHETFINSVLFKGQNEFGLKKAEIADTIGLAGTYRTIWDKYSVIIHDNNGLQSNQLSFIDNYLGLLAVKHHLNTIAVADKIGNLNSFLPELNSWGINYMNGDLINIWGDLQKGDGVNIFGAQIGSVSEHEFPTVSDPDFPPQQTDLFCIALAHEVNHIVDYYKSYLASSSTAFSQRKTALIQAANGIDFEFLRGGIYPGNVVLPASAFVEAPQEFFASISNMYFCNSSHTLQFAIHRFNEGYHQPIRQFLLFVDVYSETPTTAWFYATDTQGNLRRWSVTLTRDGNNKILSLKEGDMLYTFTYDANGNITRISSSPSIIPPKADFSGSPLSGVAPLAVAFTDQSTGTSITNWRWDFGDGVIANYGTKTNPSHLYTTPGTFDVALTVTNAAGSDTKSRPDYITVTSTPVTGVTSHMGIFRPSSRQFIFNTAPVTRTSFGMSTDIPITGDWNGDGVTDVGVFRPSSRQFIFNTAPVTRTFFGLSTDIPITGDWNGDGRTDIGVFRPSTRQFIFNTAPITRTTFGLSTDIPITGDWDGDHITDIGVFRPSAGQFIFNTAPVTRVTFGLRTDIPITGDWNGDSITDVGVFRPSTRQFVFNTAPVTRTTFGLSSDKPITGKWG